MNKDKIEISLNQEDVQNIIDCYEKDIKYIERLEKENKELKEKIEMYENPEDLTLMFMYCEEKAKDKIKQLQSVIKEIREYVKEHTYDDSLDGDGTSLMFEKANGYDLLKILDKGDQ